MPMPTTLVSIHCTRGHLAECGAPFFCDCACHVYSSAHAGAHRRPGRTALAVTRFRAWLAR